MNVRDLIRKKRLGGALSDEEITDLILSYSAGDVPEYQMSAFLMAVVWRGMNDDETVALTRAMIDSGKVLSFPALSPTADKHSTGGVGDKVSIVLAPLAAAVGLHVPMLSGRGLGHTGGTLDKLESIPGFETRLDEARFSAILADVGCVMGGQSGELAPADGRMYALRDATSTVESLPLIISSILSKKVAAGPETLVLDVKAGRGAFMPTVDEAEVLARGLVDVGLRFGKRMLAFVTNMDVPLGRAVGNALEVVESLDLLENRDVAGGFREITLLLTAAMSVSSETETTLASARTRLEDALRTGEARARFLRLVAAHGGDVPACETRALPRAPHVVSAFGPAGAVVRDIHPREVAELVVDLGGGRTVKDDDIDAAVGVWLDVVCGETVPADGRIATLHLPELPPDARDEAVHRLESAYGYDGDLRSEPRVHHVVGPRGSVRWAGWDTPLPL